MTCSGRRVVLVVAALLGAARIEARQFDADAIVQFQRAADGYAFQHRQVQRRLGANPGRGEMTAAMRDARVSAVDGDLFTPPVAFALRARIAAARGSGCAVPITGASNEVPRANQEASATVPVPACIAAVLPRLPEELEYRIAAVALLLVDTHANMVVDVLHGAFAGGATP